MSGPIIRKYGFPNFEKIFGEREIKHGAESVNESSNIDAGSAPEVDKGSPPGADATIEQKVSEDSAQL